MIDNTITIVTVNWYSYEYLNFLFENLTTKSSKNLKLYFLIVDNTNGKDDNLVKLSQKYNAKIILNDTQDLKGSDAHALGLNLALKNITTFYTLIVDPDIFVFKDNWDTFLIDLLNHNKAIVAGSTYPQWQLGKYHNFPNPVFCFFKTEEFLKLKPDWRPFENSILKKNWDFLRRNFLRLGTLIGRKAFEKSIIVRNIWPKLERSIGVCSKDTGWRVAKTACQKKIKSVIFDTALYTELPEGYKLAELARNFELYCYKNEPILVHKYSTCSILWKTKNGSSKKFWLECIQNITTS